MREFFGIKLENNNSTSGMTVVNILKTAGFSENDAINRMLAVHRNNGFLLDVDDKDKIEVLFKKLELAISLTGEHLVVGIVGPFDQYVRDAWEEELAKGIWAKLSKYAGLIAWPAATAVGVLIWLWLRR